MNNPNIDILCATDNNYVPYCGIMLTSVFENNKDSKVNAYILIDKPLSLNNKKTFTKLAKHYHQTIEFVIVDKSYLQNFPIKGMDYWSIATYYRLYAAELLPANIDKVLYLDCDIVVNGSLSPLFMLDIENKAIATVSDIFTGSDEIYERLQYDKSYGYFNAGSVLINLKYWREQKTGQKCLNYLAEHYDRIFANDQDVLNAVLYDKQVRLPISYNFQIQFLKFYNNLNKTLQNEIDTTTSPVIIHYAAPVKPWSVMYFHMPFKKEFLHYKRLSPWKYKFPILPKRKTFNYLIKRFLLWPWGIMYHQDYIER